MALFDLLPDAASLTKVSTYATETYKKVVDSNADYTQSTRTQLTDLIDEVNQVLRPLNSGFDIKNSIVGNDGSTLFVTTGQENTATNVANDIDTVSESLSGANQYDILYYPENLLNSLVDNNNYATSRSTSTRYPHAMGIFLNVNSKSKLGKYISNNSKTTTKRLDNSNISDDNPGQGIGTTSGETNENTSQVNAKFGELEIIAKFKRFTGCIMLPIPLSINPTYNAAYNEAGVGGVLGTALKILVSGGNANSALMTSTIPELAGGIVRDLAKTAASNATKALSGLETGGVKNPGGIFDKIAGTISNPRTEQVFDKIELRSWKFQWQISINSVKEWNTIRKIISLLKENMHPELDITGEGTYLVMPNEFDLEFYEKGEGGFKESLSLPKIATSALTSLSVNYTPMGHWIAFEGTMIPPFATIDAIFSEMEPLHRAMVRDVGKGNNRFTADDSVFGDKRRGF